MSLQATKTPLQDLLIIEPQLFGDQRGFFLESFNQREFNQAVGRDVEFVQDNHSRSSKGVLRGMHYQYTAPQGKLVRVVSGAVYDVAVDLRAGSPTFKQWFGIELSAANYKQLWVPEGFAHGFLVLTESAEFLYKTTDYYQPKDERALHWNDPTIAIEWPDIGVAPLLSDKDQRAPNFEIAACYP